MGNRSIVRGAREGARGVNSGIFEGLPDATLAVVDLGYGLYPDGVDGTLFSEYLRLRRDVYESLGILPRVNRVNDLEFDDDDERSVHVAAFRNLGLGRVAATACVRVIRKRDIDDHLPVERHFPEYFSQRRIGLNGGESSRLISLGHGAAGRYIPARRVIMAQLALCAQDGISDIYGMVDEGEERRFSYISGATVEKLTDAAYIEEYASRNIAIRMGVDSMIGSFPENAVVSMNVGAGNVVYIGDDSERV